MKYLLKDQWKYYFSAFVPKWILATKSGRCQDNGCILKVMAGEEYWLSILFDLIARQSKQFQVTILTGLGILSFLLSRIHISILMSYSMSLCTMISNICWRWSLIENEICYYSLNNEVRINSHIKRIYCWKMLMLDSVIGK